MNFFAKNAVATCFCLSLAFIAHGQAANEQMSTEAAAPAAKSDDPDPTSTGWHVDIAPYLWFPGIAGTVGALGHQSSVHVTAGDVLSNFNFGLMGAVEARYNRVVIPIDFMWVKLTDYKGIPITDNVESVKVKMNMDIFTPKIGYRLVDQPGFRVDWVIGIRYWHLGNTFTLQPTHIGAGFYGAANWVDGVQGARFQAFLTPKLVLTVAGDAGAGGAKLDYQVVGLLGYKLKRVTLEGGWRYLAIHKAHTDPTFADLAMSGVILGVVIPMK